MSLLNTIKAGNLDKGSSITKIIKDDFGNIFISSDTGEVLTCETSYLINSS